MMTVAYSIDNCHLDKLNFRFATAPFANKSEKKYRTHLKRTILIGRLENNSQ
jgi:hypothetical protein